MNSTFLIVGGKGLDFEGQVRLDHAYVNPHSLSYELPFPGGVPL